MGNIATNNYMVYVSCMTYNQKAYIEDALNGFCMQQTTFPFICAIIDDASTDGEQEVIKSYLSKHFDLEDKSIARNEETDDYILAFARHRNNLNCFFAVLYLKYNHYSIKKTKMPYVSEWQEHCKYIALCEGDDYWTDHLKLQKQIDYLENHSGCMMTFHRAQCHWEDGTHECYQYNMNVCEDKDYSGTELLEDWIVPCAAIVCRKEVFSYPIKHRQRFFSGDDVLYYSATEMGKVHAFSDVMSVYRVHQDSISRNKEHEIFRLKVYPDHYINIYRNFPSIDRRKLRHRIAIQIYHRMNVTPSSRLRIADWFRMLYWDPIYAQSYLFNIIKWYIIFPVKRKMKCLYNPVC